MKHRGRQAVVRTAGTSALADAVQQCWSRGPSCEPCAMPRGKLTWPLQIPPAGTRREPVTEPAAAASAAAPAAPAKAPSPAAALQAAAAGAPAGSGQEAMHLRDALMWGKMAGNQAVRCGLQKRALLPADRYGEASLPHSG